LQHKFYKMARKYVISSVIIIVLLVANGIAASAQRTIISKLSHYQLTVPGSMTKDADSNENKGEDLIFYDTVNDVMMSITARDGEFKSLDSYLDCTKLTLENDLKLAQGDSTLILLDCRKSPYYPDKSIALHFETKAYPAGLDQSMIYFFHHDKKEIQFSFVYSKADAKVDMAYIDKIMITMQLL
jgi:hypothetical protein